jgi:hypothetical protein
MTGPINLGDLLPRRRMIVLAKRPPRELADLVIIRNAVARPIGRAKEVLADIRRQVSLLLVHIAALEATSGA